MDLKQILIEIGIALKQHIIVILLGLGVILFGHFFRKENGDSGSRSQKPQPRDDYDDYDGTPLGV